MSTGGTSEPRRIGLLMVHGVGEQKRFQFLSSTVLEFAEQLKAAHPEACVSVIDRTADWKCPPGLPDSRSAAPVTLVFRADATATAEATHIRYECHEVWWADLGARSGLSDAFRFWGWGLGQWGAPIYREANYAHLANRDITTMPRSAAGRPIVEVAARMKLVLAALAVLYVAVAWVAAKRVLAWLAGHAGSPNLIVQYVGDVRTYERRASPGSTALSDPGFPLRVGIRRRMVTEMVAMACRELESWYVVAHSLGSVVAFNGLTEIGHTLPNYLSEQQWAQVPAPWKRDEECVRRRKIGEMMPARPDWLVPQDVLDRPRLFHRLGGFLTFGCPLGKFAALWPRIVPAATDRTDDRPPFPPHCRWINLAAPHDPVSGMLSGFRDGPIPPAAMPPLESYATPIGLGFGLAHLRYFSVAERFVVSRATRQKRAVMEWLLGRPAGPDLAISAIRGWRDRVVAALVYPMLVGLLWIGAAIVLTVGGGLVQGLFGKAPAFSWAAFAATLPPTLILTLAVGLVTTYVCGAHRWLVESYLNLRLAMFDKQENWVCWLLGGQTAVAALLLVPCGTSALIAIIFDLVRATAPAKAAALFPTLDMIGPAGVLSILVAIVGTSLSILAQAAVNMLFRPFRRG